MRFELFVAARYLRAKRRQAVIGVITIVSVVGVTAGVASLIVALAINNGFRQDMQQRLLGATPHVSIMRVEATGINDWRGVLERLSHAPHVLGASPAVYEQVLASRGARSHGIILKGIYPQGEKNVSDVLKSIILGSSSKLEAAESPDACGDLIDQAARDEQQSPTIGKHASEVKNSSCAHGPELPPIVLGKDLSDDLGTTVGSIVLLTSPQGELTPFGIVPKYQRFKVVGIFQSGFYDYDTGWAFTRLDDAQRLYGLGDVVNVLEFRVDDLYRAGEIGHELEQRAGKGFMATNWMEQNKAIFRALRLERMVTFITIGLIVFVAALNILISLIMMVMEKTKDVAVLMSMGARRGQVRRIFILQGVLIGFIGTVLGLVIGYGLSFAGGHYHLFALSAEVYSIDYVPFAPRAVDGIAVAIVALAMSFISTLYPSYSAARVLPAEALRYE